MMVILEPVEFCAKLRIIIIITPQGLPPGEYGCGNPEVPSCVSLCFFLSWVKHLSFVLSYNGPFLFRPTLLFSVSTSTLEPFLGDLLGGLRVSTGSCRAF